MWIFKKLFWFMILPVIALFSLLSFAFPEEMKEFKKDMVDMVENSWIRWCGFIGFIFAMTHLFGIWDDTHTLVRWKLPKD